MHQQGSQWGKMPRGSVLIHFIFNLATQISKEQGHGMPGLMLGCVFPCQRCMDIFLQRQRDHLAIKPSAFRYLSCPENCRC